MPELLGLRRAVRIEGAPRKEHAKTEFDQAFLSRGLSMETHDGGGPPGRPVRRRVFAVFAGGERKAFIDETLLVHRSGELSVDVGSHPWRTPGGAKVGAIDRERVWECVAPGHKKMRKPTSRGQLSAGRRTVVKAMATPTTPAIRAAPGPPKSRARPVDPELQALCMPDFTKLSLETKGGDSMSHGTSASLSSASSVTVTTWDDVPEAVRYFALWDGGIVYTDRGLARKSFLEAEAEGKQPSILSTRNYDEAQAFSEAVYWV
ncbi:hypothetical protein B0H14DRAFT_2570891 [Mycena olivaceomarginata]|nr:hypothetical protein B0H14DRAFT_2570891 [Mycena olivaceomarginata]